MARLIAVHFEEAANTAVMDSMGGAANADYPADVDGLEPGACTRYWELMRATFVATAAGAWDISRYADTAVYPEDDGATATTRRELNDRCANDNTGLGTPFSAGNNWGAPNTLFNAYIFVDFQVCEVNGRSRLILFAYDDPAAAAGIPLSRVRFRAWEQVTFFDPETDPPTDGYHPFLAVDQRHLLDPQDRVDLNEYLLNLGGLTQVRPVHVPGLADAIPADAGTNAALLGMRTHPTARGLTRVVTAVAGRATAALF